MKINYNISNFNKQILVDLYLSMLKPRMIEEKMLVLLRQGKISKWFSGIGQEAIAAAVVNALDENEYILPMHRNLGVFTGRNIRLSSLFSQFQGKQAGFTNGRDRSFHFGSLTHHIVGMISHLGPQMGVASGIALGNMINKKNKVCLVFTGEGGTSEGDFHEALNIASVWSLPVIFLIENNGYGLSTPVKEQYNCNKLSDRAIGYGIDGYTIDGNNVIDVFQKIQDLAKSIRKNPRPVLVECDTFRMRGHEEASGVKYVPKKLLDKWADKDPITNFENHLLKENILTSKDIFTWKENIQNEIDSSIKDAFSEKDIIADEENELNSVFKEHHLKEIPPSNDVTEVRFIDAISSALKQGMEKYDDLIFMGQDIADYGGVFKISDGFVDLFGKDRVRNTPICESIVLSMALGLSVVGLKSVVEMQFADFVSSGFNAVVNNLAKTHYRWGQSADVVVRMPCGGGVGAGPFHSQTNEAWFTHTPGLKVVYPAFPSDAKGLLLSSIEDPNPVMFFEHKALYRSVSQNVSKDYYTIPLGKANLLQSGHDLSIITYGMGVHWALDFINDNHNISIDLVDLRTLIPLDIIAIKETVIKTGKVLILHEDTHLGGFGADIASLIAKDLFEYLDAPIYRVSSLDTPVPFAADLERKYLAKNRLEHQVFELHAY
ncbi:MAG: dehydrogenase [Flavobacteriales bacterium]|nr:dehydrogenase [Flavobacteriales bacterium]MAZ58637.1 dehydrogenase [Flavobacteriales bacterium]